MLDSARSRWPRAPPCAATAMAATLLPILTWTRPPPRR